MASAPRSRHQELEAAIEKARLMPRDYRVLRELFRRATYVTGIIEDKWQPKGLADLSRKTGLGKSTICRSLDNLESLGWISRQTGGGRGKSTSYQLMAGLGQDDITRPEPLSDAARMRTYRQRKKLSHPGVTQAPETVSNWRDKLSHFDTANCPSVRNESAGQSGFSGKESVEGGKGGIGVAERPESTDLPKAGPSTNPNCSECGNPMDPALTKATGWTTHPNCEPGPKTSESRAYSSVRDSDHWPHPATY